MARHFMSRDAIRRRINECIDLMLDLHILAGSTEGFAVFEDEYREEVICKTIAQKVGKLIKEIDDFMMREFEREELDLNHNPVKFKVKGLTSQNGCRDN